MNKVELIYNPYKENSRILINGNSVSEYSQLANYLREPFEVWSSVIMDCIEQELNDDFEIIVTSNMFHCNILQEMAQRCEACVSMQVKKFAIDETVRERLLKLRRFQDVFEKTERKIKILIIANDSMISDAILGGLYKKGNYKIVDKTTVDEDCQIEIEVINSDQIIEQEKYELVIAIGEKKQELEEIRKLCFSKQTNYKKYAEVFLLENFCFDYLENMLYQFGVGRKFLLEMVCELIENLAVISYIKIQKEELSYLEKEHAYNTQEEKLEFSLIDAVEPVVVAFCQETIEEGKCIDIKVISVPESNVSPELSVKIENTAIARYQDGRLYGIADGETDIEISLKGSVEHIFRSRIRVKRVIRVSEIQISDDVSLFKVGTKYKIQYNLIPNDADNIDTLKWNSSNEYVAVVDNQGQVHCKAEGESTITIQVEDVIKQCKIQVKPEMRKIIVPQQAITLTMGRSMVFEPKCEPENCYDSRIIYDVENTDIIKYDGKKIISNGLGQTQLCFYDIEKRIKTVVDITVESTLYASEKTNMPRLYSFVIAVIALFLLAVSKPFCVIAAIVGTVIGGVAISTDYSNVEGMVNVRGEPMRPDCFVSFLFLGLNILIVVIAMLI